MPSALKNLIFFSWEAVEWYYQHQEMIDWMILLKTLKRFQMPTAGVRLTFRLHPGVILLHQDGRKQVIQSDLQNCLKAWSKSLEHPVKDRMSHKKNNCRYKLLRFVSCISKRFEGLNSFPAMPVQSHSFCFLSWLKADRTGPYTTVLARQAFPRVVSFKEVFLFSHCSYYRHFEDQKAANLPFLWKYMKHNEDNASNHFWAQLFMKSTHSCWLYFHSAWK